jgi:predicted GNAT superfamily acetyltransferase
MAPITSTDLFSIRPMKTIDECQQAEELQRRAWRVDEVDVTPAHVLLTVAKNGGVVLGAFAPLDGREHMIGFVFGFLGTREGYYGPEAPAAVKLKHCSHQLGVLPEWQGRGVGYALKVAQREAVRGQALRLITWTYDPLESRNANLNITKLGAVCNTYLRNLYGELRDDLNRGLPTDRFQVDWWIDSRRVETRLSQRRPPLTRDLYEQAGTPILNRVTFNAAGLPVPPDEVQPLESSRGLVEFPALFQDVKRLDPGLARAWREQMRAIFEAAFAAGFTVTDMVYERGVTPRAFYVITHTEAGESAVPD